MNKLSFPRILIIDGQGGKVGRQLIEAILEKLPSAEILAVGTNSIATANMIKGGAKQAATGENAVIVGCRTADLIVGPLGIVIADSLLGEVTPAMAVAIGQSRAKRLLIPLNKCDNIVIGAGGKNIADYIQKTAETVLSLCTE